MNTILQELSNKKSSEKMLIINFQYPGPVRKNNCNFCKSLF